MNNEYSMCLFTLGKEENLLDVFYNEIKALKEVFKEENINDFINNRFIKDKDKKEVLSKSLKGCHKYVSNFIYLTIDDNKIDEIIDIFEGFIDLYYKEKNIVLGTVYGISITDSKLKELEKKLSDKLNKTILLDFKKDSNLIGGYKVIVDNKLYDNSYKKKLENLKENLLKEGELND